jgi:hypothetical protein
VDGKGLAPLGKGPRIKRGLGMLTKFEHVEYGQLWSMLISRMYNECTAFIMV